MRLGQTREAAEAAADGDVPDRTRHAVLFVYDLARLFHLVKGPGDRRRKIRIDKDERGGPGIRAGNGPGWAPEVELALTVPKGRAKEKTSLARSSKMRARSPCSSATRKRSARFLGAEFGAHGIDFLARCCQPRMRQVGSKRRWKAFASVAARRGARTLAARPSVAWAVTTATVPSETAAAVSRRTSGAPRPRGAELIDEPRRGEDEAREVRGHRPVQASHSCAG